MNLLNKAVAIALVLIAGMFAGGIASATTITMDFDGLNPGTAVKNYYNGGCSGGGTNKVCGGPDYGVVWQGARVQDLAVNQPSGPNFMHPSDIDLLSTSATMNIAGGFDTGLSFYYSTLTAGDVRVFSGLDGSGSLLASLNLGFSDQCGNVPCWDFIDLSFPGTARSVIFRGILHLIGFDNLTLGAAPTASVPEPAALGMFGLGVLLIGVFAGMRRRARQS